MQATKRERLIQTKLRLSAKYENLAKTTGSKPKRVRFTNKSKRFRRQAEQLQRG